MINDKSKQNYVRKDKPKRLLEEGDIIFVRRYTNQGVRVDNHYFMVIESDEKVVNQAGYHSDLACVALSSLKSKKSNDSYNKDVFRHPVNVKVKSSHVVWYGDTNMKDAHKNKDAFVKTNQYYFFDSEDLDYEHCGEMLYRDTFDDDYINEVLDDNYLAEYNRLVGESEQSYTQIYDRIAKNREVQMNKGKSRWYEYKYVEIVENLPEYKALQKMQRSQRLDKFEAKNFIDIYNKNKDIENEK